MAGTGSELSPPAPEPLTPSLLVTGAGDKAASEVATSSDFTEGVPADGVEVFFSMGTFCNCKFHKNKKQNDQNIYTMI